MKLNSVNSTCPEESHWIPPTAGNRKCPEGKRRKSPVDLPSPPQPPESSQSWCWLCFFSVTHLLVAPYFIDLVYKQPLVTQVPSLSHSGTRLPHSCTSLGGSLLLVDSLTLSIAHTWFLCSPLCSETLYSVLLVSR